MGSIAPINLIEITEDYGEKVARVVGTRIRVSEIVMMHLKNNSSIEWIVDNFEVLDHAKIHAALAYYYQHQGEIEAEINAPQDFSDGVMLADLIAKAKRKLADRNMNNETE